MAKELIVSSTNLETRLAILEDDQVSEIFIERAKTKGILGNICKGRVTKVLPGMQAAFVDIGLERNAFLYVSDFLEEDYEEYEALFEEADDYRAPPVRGGRGRGPRGKGLSGNGHRNGGGRQNRVATSPSRPLKGLKRRAHPVQSGVLPETISIGTVEGVSFSRSEAPYLGTMPTRFEAVGGLSKQTLDHFFEDDAQDRFRRETEAAAAGGADFETAAAPVEAAAQVETGLGPARLESEAKSSRRPRRSGNGRTNNVKNQIADLLKEGQEILVQISKEPIGRKGARITSHVALPGRYMVYMPTVDHVGVSRRIFSDKERARLRNIVVDNRGADGRGFIVRTAGENHSETELVRDIEYLKGLWDDIRTRAEKAKAPSLIHSEPGLIERILRDHVSEDYRVIRVDDEQAYAHIVEFVSRFNPALVNRVRLFTKNKPIFEEFSVAPEIEKALKEKVWLKSGGHIVINQTEALVAIDVNTGKFVGSTNSLEDTITRNNLEAVKEVVRQIRLRDLGGIIIVDFIDMDERKNRNKVMEALQRELSRDKAPSKILQFNEFGLVAITRKRVKQSLQRTLCQPCIYCEGTGLTKSVTTICYSIHAEVRKILRSLGEGRELMIRCHPEVSRTLRNGESRVLREIEEMTGKTVSVKADSHLHIEQFEFVET